MANIQKRAGKDGTTYGVQVRMRGFPPQTRTFDRLTDAKAWAQETESSIQVGTHGRVQIGIRDRLRWNPHRRGGIGHSADLLEQFRIDHAGRQDKHAAPKVDLPGYSRGDARKSAS
jgi:hypothetical protein